MLPVFSLRTGSGILADEGTSVTAHGQSSFVVSFADDLLSKCWFLAGPTACGKTAASLLLAERINAEIIALDAMTIYRGMDIGTAKPTSDQQARIRHHLIDILEPDSEFSLAEYVSAAESACRDVISRGRVPLFVGGTGLYLRGILRGLFEGPTADWSIRHQLEQFSQTDGNQALHDRLRKIDPVSAARLHPNDQRRVIRAIEVFEITGQPLSALQQQGPRPIGERPLNLFWLSPPRDWLYQRIDTRVEQMFSDGLVNEVLSLIERHKPISHTARQALGYKEILDWLEQTSSSESGLSPDSQRRKIDAGQKELIALIQTRTRQFAKRQHTWFRNLEECHPIPTLGNETVETIAETIVQTSRELSQIH